VTTAQELPGRLPAWAHPVATAAAGLAMAAYVGLVDPSRGGLYPACPFHRLTGLWCPGCGMTRAVHDLLTGHVGPALSANVFVVPVVAFCGYLWLSWFWPTVSGRRLPSVSRVPAAVWATLVALLLLFGVLRNLAPFGALAT
jgi:Protein of unknown function (DUF2752)